MNPAVPVPQNAWPELVYRLQHGDPAAMEDLYQVFSGGIRFYLWRQLGPQDLNDRVHDLFLTITESIRAGQLREPECLMGFVRTVARRQIAGQIQTRREQRRNQPAGDCAPALPDRAADPENRVIRNEVSAVARRILGAMRQRDREVLIRFYFEEQTPAQICREMSLTDTQFRLLKSRAKARFETLCRGRLAPRRH